MAGASDAGSSAQVLAAAGFWVLYLKEALWDFRQAPGERLP